MNLQKSFKKIHYLPQLRAVAKKNKINIWLVGGFLRDTYLKKDKDFRDFDFCVEDKTRPAVSQFAKKTSSKIIVLDQEQDSYRVIVKKSGRIYTYDFTRMRGKDLPEDLAGRDFSINTLAVNVSDKTYQLLDYFRAGEALNRKIIKFIKKEVIRHDPLRILRAFSFMANYNFRIDKKTEQALVEYKKFLQEVSGERINEEFFKILSSPNAYPAIKKMSDLKIIDEVIPDVRPCRNVYHGRYHHLRVWEHSLETLYKFEQLVNKKIRNNQPVYDYFQQELAHGRKRVQIVKLACLLHDIGKPAAKKKKNKKTIFYAHEKIGRDLAQNIAYVLRLSFRETEVLKRLVFWHLRPGYLADQRRPSERAVYRFFRDTQEDGIAVIILSLSDWRATRGPLTNLQRRRRHEKVMLGMIDFHLREKEKKPLPKIVDGYDIMEKFKLAPSPLIGRILKKIKEEQVLGKIKTKAQAYALAKKMMKLCPKFNDEN